MATLITRNSYLQSQRAAALHSRSSAQLGAQKQVRLVMGLKYGLRHIEVTQTTKVSPVRQLCGTKTWSAASATTLEAFFKAARQPIIDCTLPADGFLVDFKPDTHAITRVSLNDDNVHAYVLPSSVEEWPSFKETKQEEEPNKHIFFHRVGPSSIGRFNETVKLLLHDQTVVVAGLSGTGKSTEVNALLMKFLGNLGAEGWPNIVAYRYDDQMVIFLLNEAGTPFVQHMPCDSLCDAYLISWSLLDEWKRTKNSSSSKPVLFLEVGESETYPQSYVPTLVYLANDKNVRETTKTWATYYFLFDPPSREDVVSQAVFLGRVANDTRLLPDEVRPTNSDFRIIMTEKGEAMIKTEMCRRFDTIGPKSRFLFETKLLYDLYVKSVVAGACMKVIKEMTASSLPMYADRYIGAFVAEGVSIPCLSDYRRHQIRFLSDFTAKLIGAKANTLAKRDLLKMHHFERQLLGAVLRHVLTLQPSSSGPFNAMTLWSIDKLKVFMKQTNTLDWVLYDGCPEGLNVCNRSLSFPQKMLEVQDLPTLESSVLYYSSAHNQSGILVDAFTVNHTTKKVYGFIVGCGVSNGCDKNDYSTVGNFMRALKIIESGYKLVYINVMNADAGVSRRKAALPKLCDVSGIGKAEKKAIDDHLERGWLAEIQVYWYPEM